MCSLAHLQSKYSGGVLSIEECCRGVLPIGITGFLVRAEKDYIIIKHAEWGVGGVRALGDCLDRRCLSSTMRAQCRVPIITHRV